MSNNNKKINITKVIEKIAMPFLLSTGFVYKKGGQGQVWRFVKSHGKLSQEIWIQKSFSPRELFLSFRSFKEPFLIPSPIYQFDKSIIEKGPPLPWDFTNEESLEKVILEMLHKVETIVIPFLNNDVENPEANKQIYQYCNRELAKKEKMLTDLVKLSEKETD